MNNYLRCLLSKNTLFGFIFVVISSFILLTFFTSKDFLHSAFTSFFYDNSVICLENNFTKDGDNILLINKELSSEKGGVEHFGSGQVNPKGFNNYVYLSSKFYSYTPSYLVFNAKDSGTVTISFGSKSSLSEFGEYQTFTDYKNLYINSKPIFSGRKTVNSFAPFKHQINVKKGDVVKVEFKLRKHIIRFGEIKRIFNLNRTAFFTAVLMVIMLYLGILRFYRSKKINSLNISDQFLLFAFIFIMALSTCVWSDAQRSVLDRRDLANEPSLYDKKAINLNYGSQYEKWFQDHFNLRAIFNKLAFNLEVLLNANPQHGGFIYQKNNNYFFESGGLNQLNRPTIIDENQLNSICTSLNGFSKEISKFGSKLYILWVPYKENVYFDRINFVKHYENKVSYQNLEKLRNCLIPKIIYPYKELKEAAQKDFVFFKAEHHWADPGAYIGYKKLMETIHLDFDNVKIASPDEFYITENKFVRGDWGRNYMQGESAVSFGFNDLQHLDVNYKYYDHKNKLLPKIEKGKDGKTFKIWKNPEVQDFKIMSTGISHNEDLNNFLPASASEMIYIRLNNVQPFKESMKFKKLFFNDVLNFKPNVIVLTIQENNFYIMNEFAAE